MVCIRKKGAKSNGGPSLLKEFSNLGGSLEMKNLGHGKDSMLECKDANLKEKQHIQRLLLEWDILRWAERTKCYDEMSLEGFQPHPNLKALELRYYMGVTISSWLSSLKNLVDLRLYGNKRLQHLPPLNQLPFLKSVSLEP